MSVHTYPDTQRIQKFPLWRAYTEISGYTKHIWWTREDARCIRIKKFADTKISGYVWTGPYWRNHSIIFSLKQITDFHSDDCMAAMCFWKNRRKIFHENRVQFFGNQHVVAMKTKYSHHLRSRKDLLHQCRALTDCVFLAPMSKHNYYNTCTLQEPNIYQ